MKTITLENVTFNQSGLTDLIGMMRWSVREKIALSLEEEYDDPYDPRLLAELVISNPEPFRQLLIEESEIMGADLQTERDVFDETFTINGVLVDEPALEQLTENLQSRNPQALENLWMDYLKSLPFDLDAFGCYLRDHGLPEELEPFLKEI